VSKFWGIGENKGRSLPSAFRRKQVPVQRRGERFGQLEPFHLAVLRYVQRLEKSLVDHPPFTRRRACVLPLAFPPDDQCRAQRALKVGNSSHSRLGGCFSVGHLARQPVHLGLEHVERHSSGVVGLEKLLPFVVEPHNALLGVVGVALGLLAVGVEFVQDAAADQVGAFWP
jgi:hypothetical protein